MKLCGIYKVQSIKKPKRIYIGSSIDIKSRWRSHIRDLRNNKHHSQKLQRHFNKYGEDDLRFLVLIECNKDELIKYEQYFLDSYKIYFNNSITAGSNLGIKRGAPWNKGKKLSKEYREKLSKSHIGQNAWNKGHKMSKDQIETNRKSHIGQRPWNKGKHYKNPKMIGNKNSKGRILTEEHKRKIGETNRRIHELKKAS